MHQFVFMRDWIFFPHLFYWIEISKKTKKKNRFVAAALNE